jgi:hypothetical protein
MPHLAVNEPSDRHHPSSVITAMMPVGLAEGFIPA